MKICLTKDRPNAKLPSRATAGSAGFDLYADLDYPVFIRPGESVHVSCGFSMELDKDQAVLICPRSGLARWHSITVLNSPGIVDYDYRGPVGVLLFNHSKDSYQLKPGDRIAQMLVINVQFPQLNVVESLSTTERGEGGFGSSGR